MVRYRRSEVHVQADAGAGDAGVDADQVAELVGEDQPAAALAVRWRWDPAGQYDPTLLAEDTVLAGQVRR